MIWTSLGNYKTNAMKSQTNNNSFGLLTAFLMIVIAGLFIQKDYMDEYPNHIHAWAEQDHYALAIGFINNGFNLFHPETMIYNKQFPDWWKTASETTITAADFPIHEYCAALLMQFFGTTSPWVFRLWTLLWGFLGLFFLYRIALRLTDDWLKSILVTTIALTSPVYAYFLNGFLPSIPALSLGIIGLWFYLKYYDSHTKRHFNLGMVFLTLAMLMRTTFAIELIAILCFEALRIFRKESTWPDKLPAVFLSALVFMAYFLWNRHLRNLYGTIFLNQLLPPEDWQDAKELIVKAYNNWGFHYFQKFQYIVFLLIALVAIGIAIYQSTRKEATVSSSRKPLSLWWLPMIEVFGCLLFSVAMMQQMPNHDYYLIDTFFLPVLIIIALLLNVLPKSLNSNGMICFFVGIICAIMVFNVTKTQIERRDDNDLSHISYINYKDADVFLDSLGIPRDAKIVCLYGFPQNGPFLQMQRKGLTAMWEKGRLPDAIENWEFDYIVIEDYQFVSHFEERKALLTRLKKVGNNGKISVCTLSDRPLRHDAWEFFYYD